MMEETISDARGCNVSLTDDQRQTLEQWARGRSLPARQVERARIVLLAASGEQDIAIADQLRITNQKSGALAEALPGRGYRRPGEGRAQAGTNAEHPDGYGAAGDSQDDTTEAGQRHSLVHAHHGRGGGHQ